MTSGRRAARYAAYGVAVLLVLLVATALVIPEFLDTQRVGAELQAKLSQALHGEVAWQKLRIRLLPSPHGALSEVRVEIPETASVRAAQVDARLRLLPLLRGRAEIASMSLSKPVIRLEIAPSPPAQGKAVEEAPADPVEAYRFAIDAIRRFAPEAELEVDDADLDVRVSGLPPIRLRRLEVSAKTESKGLDVELAAESEYASGVKVSAHVAFSDLSGSAILKVAEARPQAWLDHFLAKSPVTVTLPSASLSAQARTDGKAKLECDFALSARAVGIARAEARLQVPDVALAGGVAMGGQELTVRLKNAKLGPSSLADGTLRYSLKESSLSGLAEFDLDLAQATDGVRRMLAQEAGEALAAIEPVTGRARGQVKVAAGRSGWSVLTEIRQSDSSVGIEGAPGPVKLAAGSVEATGDAVRIERADLSMLDSRVLASARIGYGGQLRIEGAVSEGSVGESLLAWVWKTAGAPAHLKLKTPIRVEVQRAAWSPKRPLELVATASFAAGPSLAVDLGWTPDVLDIRRAVIKDERSDATVALHVEEGLLEGRFSGSLQSASVGATLKGATVPSGGGSGDLRFRFDLKHPERFTATGKLKGTSIDLSWLLERPVMIERVELDADGEKLHIRQARANWAKQRFALSGDLTRAADGAPIVDARLESPGVIVDALLPQAEDKKPAAPEEKAKAPWPDETLWTRWPLPVRGRIALRSKFVQYGERKAEPLVAALVLQEQKASLELQQVQLCGISLPLTVEATAEGLAIAARIAAEKQQLEETARCLTERGVLITGDFDLRAELRTKGRLRELLPNLEGTVSAQSREGRVMKFALLGNILSLTNVARVLKEGGPKLNEAGFPYRRITARGRFEGGSFIIEESSFRSDAVGLAANGRISLVDYDSRLTVLVAPFERLDRLVRGVPLFGYVVGGILTSIPVGVSGDIRNPLVIPLGPGAVTSELKGVFDRTINLPGMLVPQQGGNPTAEPPSAQ